MDFRETFLRSLLSEADEPLPPDHSSGDSEAFNAAMDKDTPAGTFDVKPLEHGGALDYIETGKHWIHKLESIANELNDVTPESLNSQITQLDVEGSPFRGVEKTLSSDIVGCAETLKAMAEQLKGYIIGAPKKHRENIQQSMAPTKSSSSS